MAACPREQGSLHRLQQAQHLAEQAQLNTRPDAHDRTADLDLDRRRARTAIRHHRNKIGSVRASLGHRIGTRSELPPPPIELVAMQPVAQRDLARLRARRLALRDDRSLLLIAPASAARRSCQHFHATETVPINWQITWHTIPLPRSNQGRITPFPSSAATWGSGSAYPYIGAGWLCSMCRRGTGGSVSICRHGAGRVCFDLLARRESDLSRSTGAGPDRCVSMRRRGAGGIMARPGRCIPMYRRGAGW